MFLFKAISNGPGTAKNGLFILGELALNTGVVRLSQIAADIGQGQKSVKFGATHDG